MLTIYVASDHAGFSLKEKINCLMNNDGYLVHDLGPGRIDSEDDFPDYAKTVCQKVVSSNNSIGILICGTGQGMAIAANKIKGVRATVCWNEKTARQAREHLNSNILCLGASYLNVHETKKIIETFLETSFSEQKKYSRRIEKITGLETTYNAKRNHCAEEEGTPMLKAYIATTKWPADDTGYIPYGVKIILEDSREKAEQTLQEWTKNYFAAMGTEVDGDCKSIINWEIEERPPEKGILWDNGIRYLNPLRI